MTSVARKSKSSKKASGASFGAPSPAATPLPSSPVAADDFRVIRASIPVHLPPSRLSNVEWGVREQLNQYLLRYVEELGGVVMLYRNVELPRTRLGVVFQNRSQVHFKVKVEFLIFAPMVDTTIVGRVTTVAHDHIFLLVHQCWNVTIPRDEIPDYWRYDRTADRFVDGRAATASFSPKNIGVDTIIRCRVARLENVGGHFRMAGSLKGSGVAVLEDSAPPALERSSSSSSAAANGSTSSNGVKRKRGNDVISSDNSKWAAQLGNELEEAKDDDDDDDSNDTNEQKSSVAANITATPSITAVVASPVIAAKGSKKAKTGSASITTSSSSSSSITISTPSSSLSSKKLLSSQSSVASPVAPKSTKASTDKKAKSTKKGVVKSE